MKRSKFIGLTLMGTVPFLLTACEQPAPPPAPQSLAYGSVDECIQAGIFTPQACENGQVAAVQAHRSEAPRFASASECEQQYGANNCQVVRSESGGSWFMPAMAGFMMGQMFSGGGYHGAYRGEPLYRDRYDRNSWRTADNRPVQTGKADKAITRSRGGFGSQAAARGSWGS
jgi:uncharacterized protein YgiB involved in biofilm formation